MAESFNERLFIPHPPASHAERQEFAVLYCNDTHPFREHVVCYRAACPDGDRARFIVASMSSKDSAFFDYNGGAAAERGLVAGSIYLVRNSPRVVGEDTEHVIIALADKTIEFTGMAFNISQPIQAPSAAAALWQHVRIWLEAETGEERELTL